MTDTTQNAASHFYPTFCFRASSVVASVVDNAPRSRKSKSGAAKSNIECPLKGKRHAHTCRINENPLPVLWLEHGNATAQRCVIPPFSM